MGRLGQAGIAAEQPFGFAFRKSRKPRRLEIGGAPVGLLDLPRDLFCGHRRQSEADMARRQQPFFDRLVVAAEHRFERRDHVADDIFRRVVQQGREPHRCIEPRRLFAHHGFDQQRVLRDREDMRAAGLAVPARNACQPMGDIGYLDVER